MLKYRNPIFIPFHDLGKFLARFVLDVRMVNRSVRSWADLAILPWVSKCVYWHCSFKRNCSKIWLHSVWPCLFARYTIDLSVSVPMLIGAKLAATPIALPEDDLHRV